MNSTINVPLLRKVMEHIENFPEEWNQAAWRIRYGYSPSCGTTMCFAGHAAEIMGCEWSEDLTEYVMANEADNQQCVVRTHGGVIWVRERAKRLLGLSEDEATDLFSATNTLEDLQNKVAELTAKAHEAEVSRLEDELKEKGLWLST